MFLNARHQSPAHENGIGFIAAGLMAKSLIAEIENRDIPKAQLP